MKKAYKEIFLTGTHHSGKSTLIEKFKDYYNAMDEPARLFMGGNYFFTKDKFLDFKTQRDKQNYKFTEEVVLDFCSSIINNFELLDDSKPWLFDRCIIDVIYYLEFFNKKDSFKPLSSTINRAYKVLYEAIEKGFFADTLLILLKPIPILSWDGVRLGEKEQLEVFEIAKKVLFKLKELNSIEATSKQASEIIKNNLKFKE